MPDDTIRSATYTVPCEDYVHVVEFSPYDCGSPASLLAYGGNQHVVVAACRFKVLPSRSNTHFCYFYLIVVEFQIAA